MTCGAVEDNTEEHEDGEGGGESKVLKAQKRLLGFLVLVVLGLTGISGRRDRVSAEPGLSSGLARALVGSERTGYKRESSGIESSTK